MSDSNADTDADDPYLAELLQRADAAMRETQFDLASQLYTEVLADDIVGMLTWASDNSALEVCESNIGGILYRRGLAYLGMASLRHALCDFGASFRLCSSGWPGLFAATSLLCTTEDLSIYNPEAAMNSVPLIRAEGIADSSVAPLAKLVEALVLLCNRKFADAEAILNADDSELRELPDFGELLWHVRRRAVISRSQEVLQERVLRAVGAFD